MNFGCWSRRQISLIPDFAASFGASQGQLRRGMHSFYGATQEKLKQFGGQTPLGRPDQPVELASIYVQLAANDASYATGQVYGAAGGSGQA